MCVSEIREKVRIGARKRQSGMVRKINKINKINIDQDLRNDKYGREYATRPRDAEKDAGNERRAKV